MKVRSDDARVPLRLFQYFALGFSCESHRLWVQRRREEHSALLQVADSPVGVALSATVIEPSNPPERAAAQHSWQWRLLL